jgi:hypothetical protein
LIGRRSGQVAAGGRDGNAPRRSTERDPPHHCGRAQPPMVLDHPRLLEVLLGPPINLAAGYATIRP